MASLNQIAERIAYALGEPNNYVLKEHIKFSVRYYRALLIRRDIVANGSNGDFLQRFYVDLKKVDKADSCDFTVDCTVLRTVSEIPSLVRINSDTTFKFVGTVDGKKSFAYTEYEEVAYRLANKYTGKEPIFTWVNGYIYIFNYTKIKRIAVEAILFDPMTVSSCSDVCLTDDDPFPIGEDMLSDIFNNIVSKEFRLVNPVDQQVSIEPNDNLIK